MLWFPLHRHEATYFFFKGSALDEWLEGALWVLAVCGVVSHFHYNFWGGRVGAVVGFEWGRVWGVLRVAVVDFVCLGGWLFFHFVVLGFGAWI